MVGAIAYFALFVWTIYKVERSLNERGDSLFFPWVAATGRDVCHAPTVGRTVSWSAVRRDRANGRAGGHHIHGLAAGGAFVEDFSRADEAGEFLAAIKG